jgi:hypothetical protein
VLQLCDGRNNSYVFGFATRFKVTARLMVCIARGGEAGAYDKLADKYTHSKANRFYLDESDA